MASLPNKSFVFNYNARDYNTSTHTIPRTSGQTLAQDMVWSGKTSSVVNQITFDDDHITVPMSAYSPFIFSTSGANPLNMGSGNNSMTIIAKVKKTNTSTTSPTNGQNVITNRMSGTWNWMARTRSDGYLAFSYRGATDQPANMAPYTTGSVVTVAYKIDNGTLSIWNLTTNVKSTPISTAYNAGVDRFCFFASLHSGSTSIATEMMSGDFYWCYCSREALTDEEIQQVIDFNESTFGPDEDSADVPVSGGIVSVNLSAEGVSWTASTASNWITISPTTGTGDSTVTLTVKANNFSERTGTVTFASGAGDEAEFTVSQGGTDGIVPYKKIYRNNRRIN